MWAKSWQFLWQWRGVGITAPSVAILIIIVRCLGLLQPWEWAVYDQFMRLRPASETDDRIAIVGINEADIQAVGSAIIADEVYGSLIAKLTAMKPKAIGLDIYRDLPVEPGHQELVAIFESTPNVIGIEKVVGDRDRDFIPGPPALVEKGQVAANDVIPDADNTVRRAFLSLSRPDNSTIPSLGMYLAALYLQDLGIGLQADPTTGFWQLGETLFQEFKPNDGSYIRADAGGYQQILNYRGGSQHFETVALMDVLGDRLPEDWGRDRIILIGMVGESSNDFFPTPYSSTLLSTPEPMAGVEIHANIASHILSTVLDDRPFIQSWPEPVEWLWILVWSSTGAILAWRWRYAKKGVVAILRRVTAFCVVMSALVIGSYGALLAGWWLPIVPPLLAMGGSAIAIVAYIARTASDLRKTFGRYLTDEVVANLLEHPEGLTMGGERREITILTSDLRGFTALSERLSPEEVVKILNFYLGKMADVITAYQGTIDEFMGDGILVLFGAPTTRSNDAERAIACAVAMQQAMTEVNQTMKAWGLPDLEMGIGINTGEVVVGNIGSEKRTKYGVVGSQVNLTYRIESYTTGGQILISEQTLKTAQVDVKINGHKSVSPKGVKKPITIYDVGGIGSPYNLNLVTETEQFFPLQQPLALEYAVLEGKNISPVKVFADLVQLSQHGGQIHITDSQQGIPPALANIKLSFLDLTIAEMESEDVYGKVLEKDSEPQSFYLKFTSKPPSINRKLAYLYESLERDRP
ncbi:MAG: adenylate/guanylate cyclase domain-containing protein [Jaaginema sp. PMC 1079.18]|nr:adenylate/guanylate cyclase domain-containing protein [Jaaginema sp. PMC 1080.18]MEC4849480.1 adenylate/guanylate cyclase domain-containing protein [Jaaginema sp. PMC 1079.18]MEC4866016.1 adenylate/guanylate cyclase domain-containing protein [Jaaginema sp. PMC 1078.18]